MKIAILKDWNTTFNEFVDHWDGIMAAFGELSKKHEVVFITKLGKNEYNFVHEGLNVFSFHGHLTLPSLFDGVGVDLPDALISWGSLDRPWHGLLDEIKCPKILCHAGGPTNHEFAKHFDVFACESQVYIDRYKGAGAKTIRAFGTNTKIFNPETRTPKLLHAIYPASFCFHKNQELFARATFGLPSLCVGPHNEPTIVDKLIQLRSPFVGRVSSETLADLYRASYSTVIPCGPDGGAQRVVLESMACGTPVIVSEDNDKCVEFVKESGFGRIVTPVDIEIREAIESLRNDPPDPMIGVNYVKSKWTETHYADALLEAISIAKSARGVV